MNEIVFGAGFLTCAVISLASSFCYKATLKIKAERGESEKIHGSWVKLSTEGMTDEPIKRTR